VGCFLLGADRVSEEYFGEGGEMVYRPLILVVGCISVSSIGWPSNHSVKSVQNWLIRSLLVLSYRYCGLTRFVVVVGRGVCDVLQRCFRGLEGGG
jgi:hypothetical protein